MRMRPYQVAAAEKVMEALVDNASTLVVMPTGSGKTVLFAEIIRRFRERDAAAYPGLQPGIALVVAHREELITQAAAKIARVTKLRCEIEMADQRVCFRDLFGKVDVVVSTIQTQAAGGDGGGRMTKFDPQHFSLLVIDEGHHATSATYRRIIAYYRNNANIKILGVTATPDRSDAEALGQVFDTVAYEYEIIDAIADGWLVDIEQHMVSVAGLDYSRVRTRGEDLNGVDLAAVLETEKNLQGVAGPSIEMIGDRRALAFTASVKQAELLCEIFNRHRSGMAAWVCGETDKVERRKILGEFRAGRIQVVCNCGVLVEGFDDAGIEYVLMAKPTRSRSAYCQMVGRALRPHDSIAHELNDVGTVEARRALVGASAKPCCRVIDFVGNCGKHKLMTTADILGGKVTEDVLTRAVANVRKAGTGVRMSEAIAAAAVELEAEKEQRRREAHARRLRLLATVSYTTERVNPFDRYRGHPSFARDWKGEKSLSEKQKAILAKQGIDASKMEYGEAKALLDDIFRRWDGGLCSVKQAKLLKKHGLNPEMTRAEASAAIEKMFATGADMQAAFQRGSG